MSGHWIKLSDEALKRLGIKTVAVQIDSAAATRTLGGEVVVPEGVLVERPLKSTDKGLVVPSAAVLYDIHGDTWIYEDLGGNAYARRRVQVARHAGDRAVITRGIGEGANVVTAGAAELFGTEFGAGH